MLYIEIGGLGVAAFCQSTGGRVVEWHFQSGEPVWYCNDTVSGYTTIKDILQAGTFTVHMAPTVKNEIGLAEKYVSRVRTLATIRIDVLQTLSMLPRSFSMIFSSRRYTNYQWTLFVKYTGVSSVHLQKHSYGTDC